MSALPPDVHEVLLQLLQGLSSADNTIRADAEKSLENDWTQKENVEMLLMFLAENACSAANDTLRAFSAVVFRRIAIKSPKQFTSVVDRTIGTISEPVRKQIRQTLLQGFTSQQSNQVRHKLSDAISEVAKEDASPPGTWPELLPALFSASTSQDASFRESAFRVFSSTPELIDLSYINEILPVFKAGFGDANDDVRIAACTAFVAFFRELPKQNWQALSPLLPDLLNSLPRFLSNGQEQALALVLELLIDLVELAPKMFKAMFPTIIEFCSAVSKNKELDSSARMAALELLTTFSEVAPVMCKLTPSYTSTVVLVTLVMLTEVCPDDDEAAEWNNNDDTDDDDEEPEFDAARQALDRVALKLTGKALAQPLFQYLPAMLQSEQWRERQAALMALSAAAEGCADVLMSEIPRILDMILPALQDPHPRVQYACCNALGQMSTDFADFIQRTAHDRILPGLISKLTNKSVPRVQAHAAAALVNFSEAASKEIMEPYLDELLSNLLDLLQLPKRYVQEQVLTTIAITADAAQQTFVKYYDTLMPLLMNVLSMDMDSEARLLKAKSIECSTLIALAVGKDKFMPHCKDLINLFGRLQETITDDDDPAKLYLEQGWGRICRIIGKDFLPYLPAVLPPLLTSGKAAQDISLLEEEEAEEFNTNEEWDVINISGKLIAVHTAALDEKVSAIDLLRTYAIQLKADFFPWVKEIVQEIGIPALDFYLHDGVRGSAALTLAALLRCSVYATGANSEDTLTLWAMISTKLFSVLPNEPVPELLVAYYTAIVESIGVLGQGALTAEQLQTLASAINANLCEIYERIKDRDSADDEYTEDVDDNDDEFTDEELLDEINKAVLAIFKSSKSQFLPAFQGLIPTIASFLNDENTNVKLCGLCVVCDLLEHCGSDFTYTEMFTGVVAELLTSPHASIRQAASYSVGMAAQHGGPSYKEFALACLEPMFKMAAVPDARADENVYATENLVLAIAKVCRSFSADVPNLGSVLQQWINLLPILQDEEAAPFAYSFLAELIQSQHPAVASQVLKVVDSILQALSHKSISGATAQKVAAAARQLLGTLPQSEAVALLQNPSYASAAQEYFS